MFLLNGRNPAFLKMKESDYESDNNWIIIVLGVSVSEEIQELFASDDGRGTWDQNSSSITWSGYSKQVLVTAEKQGRVKLPQLSVASNELPVALRDEVCISSVKISAGDGNWLFFISSTFANSYRYTNFDPSFTTPPEILHSSSSFILSTFQISDIWYPSVNDDVIYVFIVTPMASINRHSIRSYL